MKRKLILITICFLLVICGKAFTENIEESFTKAVDLYKDGQYGAAVTQFEKLILADPYRAEFYYNLGNSYFKNDNLGHAILNYERAKVLAPRDSDIRSNLGYANRLIQFELEDERNWYWKKAVNLVGRFTFWELAAASSVYSLLFMTPIVFRLIRKRSSLKGRFTIFFGILFLVSLVPLAFKFYLMRYAPKAIVTDVKAEVRYGPSMRDKISFRLVEGLKIRVEDKRDGWYRIALVNGETGWVKAEDITKI